MRESGNSQSVTAQAVTAESTTRWPALYVASILSGFLLLGISDANVALPSIALSLHVGSASLQLISVGYVVTFGLTLVPFGRLGDQGHRRRLILGGLVLYVAASLLCGLAAGWSMLMAGRIALGISAGVLMPQTIGVIQQLFSGAERGKAFGNYGVMTAVALASGPSAGGLLVTLGGPDEGWRWIFLMNVPVGIGLFAASLKYLPLSQIVSAESADRSFDPFGAVLLGTGVLLVLYPFVFTTGLPGDSAKRWLVLVPAALVLALFWRWERRYAADGRLPLLDAALLRTPSYRNAMLVAAIWLACGPGVSLALMLYLQLALGLSPVTAALVLLPSSVGSAIGARWAARRVLRWGRIITIAGLLASATGIVGSALVAAYLPVAMGGLLIAGTQFVNGLGSGMVISPNHVLLLLDVPPEKGSLAASIGHLTQRIGNSLGLAATSAAFYSVIYGAAGQLSDAGRGTYLRALVAGYAAAGAFFALALAAAVADMLRIWRASHGGAQRAVGADEAGTGMDVLECEVAE